MKNSIPMTNPELKFQIALMFYDKCYSFHEIDDSIDIENALTHECFKAYEELCASRNLFTNEQVIANVMLIAYEHINSADDNSQRVLTFAKDYIYCNTEI